MLVVFGLIFQDVGASVAVLLFPEVGPAGMVSLRLVFSAAILLAIARPNLRAISKRAWLMALVFGISLGGMNLLFYEALSRVDLGATVTIEVLGPLVLSVIVARRASAWLWAVLAFAGVALLSLGSVGALDPVGVAFALAAAVSWAGYILASRKTGQVFAGLDGLAIAMAIGAIISLPFGITQAGSTLLEPSILVRGLAVAICSSAIPYALELIALRRISAAAFSVLMALAPAIATGAGFFVLGQNITLIQGVGIALVIAASIGAVRAASRIPGAPGAGPNALLPEETPL
ncbi:EamA family transporter [Salinibacterium sp. PAMC 21357]|uniref:EamA family transporter n=1 Tax=Salinibacterium sp. PAMC 21357 TaxID=1112215 RepID=UPI000288FDB8|nr:EamA family transporter [Salinibacterium sp. PAMC 21357]